VQGTSNGRIAQMKWNKSYAGVGYSNERTKLHKDSSNTLHVGLKFEGTKGFVSQEY